MINLAPGLPELSRSDTRQPDLVDIIIHTDMRDKRHRGRTTFLAYTYKLGDPLEDLLTTDRKKRLSYGVGIHIS